MHKPSGTLIATDLIWNYPKTGTNKGTQAWKFGMDRVYLPFYKRFMIKDKGAFKSIYKHICLIASEHDVSVEHFTALHRLLLCMM